MKNPYQFKNCEAFTSKNPRFDVTLLGTSEYYKKV